MNDKLTQSARGLIDEARRYEVPHPRSKARVRAALLGALGGAALSTTTGSAVAAFKMGLAAKVGAGLAAAALAGGLGWRLVRSPEPTLTSSNEAPLGEMTWPVVIEMNEPVGQEPDPKPPSPTLNSRRPGQRPVAAQASTTSQLTEETNQLAAIHRRLQAGDAVGAMPLIVAYQHAFRNGVLREESDAAHVTALIDLNRRSEACQLLRRFEARWPRSPHMERLKPSCK